MFSWYVLNVKPYIQLHLCVYGIYFAAKYIFQRFMKSQRGCGLQFLPTLLSYNSYFRGKKLGTTEQGSHSSRFPSIFGTQKIHVRESVSYEIRVNI